MTPTPVTVLTGPLGIGKTTAILDTFRHRPDGERWAVLVNEFGRVGIDGATLSSGGVAVREIPGGCVCCAQGPQLQVALVQLLREVRPHRLWIEPSGLALPGAILDLLGRPGIAESVQRRATIALVDPRDFATGRWADRDADVAQIDAADVLVANRADLYGADVLDAFRAAAGALWPAKAVVAVTERGRLDPAWFDLDPRPPAPMRWTPVSAARGHGVAEEGWVWPPEVRFDRSRLLEAIQAIAAPGGPLPQGAKRVKGLFRTTRGWIRVDVADDRLEAWPFQRRTDSRLEVIAPMAPPPSWPDVRARVEAAIVDGAARPA